MSELTTKVAKRINARFGEKTLDGTYKLILEGEPVFIDQNGAHLIDETADCTITMSEKNFTKLIKGDLNPAIAVMTGKIKIAGDLKLATKLSSLLG
ncbi:MAG: SCP2 sterol-binding domain-containing protein [Pseudoruegeria sp.]